MKGAEQLLEITMRDWKEKVNPGKTEGLRLSTRGRAPFDVRYKGEAAVVRHVGGLLMESGGRKQIIADGDPLGSIRSQRPQGLGSLAIVRSREKCRIAFG